jgi:hypothetical protein
MPTRRFPAASLFTALIAGPAILWLASCASEHLVADPPGGVNLTGNWKLNLNLSDDPDRLMDQDKGLSKPDTGGRRRRGRDIPDSGSGPGLPPVGSSPEGPGWSGGPGTQFAPNTSGPLSARSFEGAGLASPTARESALSEDWAGLPLAALAPGIEQSNPLPPSSMPSPDASSHGRSAVARLLAAPNLLSIHQDGAKVTIRARMADGAASADDFVAGTKGTVNYGKDGTAEREAGWRGPVFITTLKTKKGWREDDYALDEDGRLIVTSEVKASHVRQLDIKHVYDRINP